MGQGRENARQFLKDNKDVRQEIENRLRQGLGLPVLEEAAAAAARADKAEKGSVVPMPEKRKA
jgi:recombination protein RecA